MGSAWSASESVKTTLETRMAFVDRDSPVDVMLVSNIPEEPYLALRHEHSYAQSVYRCISKSLVIEASSSIQPVKVSFVSFTAEEV